MSDTQLAAGFIIGSAFLHAIFNAFLKIGGDRYVRRGLMNLGAAAAVAPLAFFVPLPTPEAWIHLAAGVALLAVYQVAQIESYKAGDFSAVYPVARGSSVALTAIGAAVLFPETFPPLKVAGFVLVILALTQFRAGPSGARGLALAWALATAVMIAFYTLNDAGGVRAATSAASYAVWFFITQGAALPLYAAAKRRRALPALVRREWRISAACVLLMVGSYTLNLYALRLGAVAEIAALRETGVLFGALIGAVVFKESFGVRRSAAAAVLVAALVLIQTA